MNVLAHRLISPVAFLGPCHENARATRDMRRDERLGGRLSRRREARRGTTLLLCLFVMFFTSLVLVGLLQSVRLQVAQQRATMEYERANYLAGAAVNHAMTLLEANIDWRGEIAETPFADGSEETYAASVANEINGGVLITARGTSGSITRRLQVIVE